MVLRFPRNSFDLPEKPMETNFRNRDQLYRSAVEALGEEEADTLMSSLPPMDWSQIATKSDLDALRIATKSDFEKVDLKIEKVDLKMEKLEHKLTAAIESGLRKQTQWVFGAVLVLAVSTIGGTVATIVTVLSRT